jgi:diacylglycerol O-acyltransferase / wax synthase
VLTELTGFAPPNIMSQASRVIARQRMFNLVVTNVPGPQFALYMMGRKLEGLFPMVPLAPNQALGIAIMSYNGTINFGLVGDYDLMSDLDELADDLQASLAELAEAAGVQLSAGPRRAGRRRRSPRSNGHKPGGRIGSTSTVTTSGDSEK